MNSESFDQAVATLNDLGLTIVQAKVYMILLRSESLTIETISNLSHVARTDLYRVTHELEKKGLVERILSNPTQFKPTPLTECLPVLLQRKNEENRELQTRTLRLLSDYQNINSANLYENNKSLYILVPSGRVVEKIANAINASRKSIDLSLSWDRFSHGIVRFHKLLGDAWSREVKCRIVLEKPEGKRLPLDFTKSCRKSQSCEVRFVYSSLHTVLGIYDKKEVFIIENPAAELPASPGLWSNNHSLLSLANDYFDTFWLTATEVDIQARAISDAL